MRTVKILQGHRWFIWTIVFISVSLIALTTYILYVSNADITDVFVISTSRNKNQRPTEKSNKFSGFWNWKDGNEEFTLDLNLQNNSLTGYYCYLINKAELIDCNRVSWTDDYSKDYYFRGTLKGSNVNIEFVDSRTNQIGNGVLVYHKENDTLEWVMTKPPSIPGKYSDYLIPDTATFKRDLEMQAQNNVAALPEVRDFLQLLNNKGKIFGIAIDTNSSDLKSKNPYYSVHVYEDKEDHIATFGWYRYYINSNKAENYDNNPCFGIPDGNCRE